MATLTTFDPPSGPIAGGNPVTFYGTGFSTITNPVLVMHLLTSGEWIYNLPVTVVNDTTGRVASWPGSPSGLGDVADISLEPLGGPSAAGLHNGYRWVRRYCDEPAVLTLEVPGESLDLMDKDTGFVVSEVNLGYPDVRDDSNYAADRHGRIDLTHLFGARAVSITAGVASRPSEGRQGPLDALAPYLLPGNRPVLTYRIDPADETRQIRLRPSQYSGPYRNRWLTEVQCGWVAPYPVAYSVPVQMVTAPATAFWMGARNDGDITTYPLIRMWGPGSRFRFAWADFWGDVSKLFEFQLSLVMVTGDWIEIDALHRTVLAFGDPNRNYAYFVYWPTAKWPRILPGHEGFYSYAADGATADTRLEVLWQSAHLF